MDRVRTQGPRVLGRNNIVFVRLFQRRCMPLFYTHFFFVILAGVVVIQILKFLHCASVVDSFNDQSDSYML